MPTPASMPQRRPGLCRETFQAFARANTRDDLMDAMRAQAEAYFGCKVELCKSSAQPAGVRSVVTQYQGSSFWVARP